MKCVGPVISNKPIPGRQMPLWAEVDRKLTDEAAWIPYLTPRQLVFTSTRVGNVQYHPSWGLLLDQLWVR